MAASRDDDVQLDDVKIKVVTDKAYLIVYEEEEYWIPKSQVSDDSEISEVGEVGSFTITQWIAKEKGLE